MKKPNRETLEQEKLAFYKALARTKWESEQQINECVKSLIEYVHEPYRSKILVTAYGLIGHKLYVQNAIEECEVKGHIESAWEQIIQTVPILKDKIHHPSILNEAITEALATLKKKRMLA